MSLVTPEHFNISPIIALDPGADSTGLAIFMVNFRTGEIVSIETYTLLTKKMPDPEGLDTDLHTERAVKLSKLYHGLTWFFHKYRPVDIVSEAPFFNRLAPMAYGSLTEVVAIVKRAMIDYNPNLTLTVYPPLSVKQGVGTVATKKDAEKGKQLVRDAIARIPAIMDVLQKPLDQMTEHEVDGTAVGYTHIKKLELP